jgi:alpha-mannosidase
MMKYSKRKNFEPKIQADQLRKTIHKPHLLYKAAQIRKRIYTKVTDLDVWTIKSTEPIPFSERDNHQAVPIKPGEAWGGKFDCAWFNIKGKIPDQVQGEHVVMILDLQGEGCVVDSSGEPLKGLASILCVSDLLNTVPGKKTYDITLESKGSEKVDLWVDAGNNGVFLIFNRKARLKRAELARVNHSAYDLYFDFVTLLTGLYGLEKDSARFMEVNSALNEASKILKKYSGEEISKAKAVLKTVLEKPSHEDFTYYATGHGHLDLAWLWPIRETKRKGARTFTNQLDLMAKYPEYVFCASQPQLYQWMKDDYPGLYEKISQAVKEGNLEPVGGTWAEPDCNLPSGEALIRQFLYGKSFFRKEFGKEMKVCFLPDVFGFTAALPQIIKKCGVDYFLTIKLSWNEYNEFPYTSFIWEGLDGSSVISHIPVATNYNADLSGYYLNKCAEHNKNRDVNISSTLFGVGDGGGGPSEVQVEMMRRNSNLEGITKIIPSTVDHFFSKLADYKDQLPVHQGELYLEKHTGTYTTQAKTKYYNRKLEIELHNTESLASYAYIYAGYKYPHERLKQIWQEVLLYQFHDILPGSSIKRVHDECLARYQALLEELKALQKEISKALKPEDSLWAYNASPFDRKEYITFNGEWFLAEVPAYASAKLQEVGSVTGLGYTADTIYSDQLTIGFNMDGSIKSLKRNESGKEMVKGDFNRLNVYHDKKTFFNAWDIEPGYIRKKLGTFRLVESKTFLDKARVVRRNLMKYGKSTLTQDVILTLGCPYAEFETTVDWHQKHHMLRADFIPSVYADKVKCDIQFGFIERGTGTADRVSYAQYEIPAHKWVALEQGGHGFALLNDCKYGHRVKDGLVSLNLLRSTVFPDPTADRGEQKFRYAVYPYEVNGSELIKYGYHFNNGLIPFSAEVKSIFKTDNADIIIETVKKAEEEDGIIVRLFECRGRAAKASLKTTLQGYEARAVNMIEDHMQGETIDPDHLTFTPFEVKTILYKK